MGRRRFADLLTAGGRIYHETHYAPLLRMQGSVREIALELVAASGARLPVLVNSVMRRGPGGEPAAVRTVVLEATERREYERELLRARRAAQDSEARARVLAQTLQQSLLPPSVPAVPGIDIAARYRPAGKGEEVGGDFYDVFETRWGDWVVVVGDVVGKGAEAAALTALSRYTVRAAAMRTRRPSLVLRTLSEALLRNGADRFCTVAFVRIGRDRNGGVQLTLASGGHPLPLLLRDGAVTRIGRPGGVLGAWEDPLLHDARVSLRAGDVVVVYTDGVTEARRGTEFFGEDALRAVLASCAGEDGATIARRVVDEVVDFQAGLPRDDIAVVALRVP